MKNNYKTISASIEKTVLFITLNRPDKRNSLNLEMVRELKAVLNQYKNNNSISAIILTGAGKAFCAGADLAYLKSLLNHDYEQNVKDSIELKDLYYLLYTYPKITLAMVNGAAVAGGCGLVNVCDFVFSVESAKFGYPEVKIGFVASMVSIFLVQTVGERYAKKLLLTGNLITAQEAKKIGLVDELIPASEIRNYSLSFLNNLIENSPQSINNSKKLFSNIIFDDIDTKLQKACEFNAETRSTYDFKEGINSFLEKRKPNWGSNLE